MLALQLFLWCKRWWGREGVEELGEFVAGLWKVVLNNAGGLVAVEPSMSVIVKLPALGERSHDRRQIRARAGLLLSIVKTLVLSCL
jgi:hypothetical protein